MGAGFSSKVKFENMAAEAIYTFIQTEAQKVYTGPEKNTVLKPLLTQLAKYLTKIPVNQRQLPLTIRDVAIGEKGGTFITKLIQDHIEIDQLELINCGITDAHMATLFSSLNIPRGMKRMLVSGNQIGEQAAAKLLIAFNGHLGKSIQHLSLGEVAFLEEQFVSFFVRLYSTPKLEYLDLSQIKIPNSMYPVIIGALYTNHVIREIVFSSNAESAFVEKARSHMERNQAVNEVMDKVLEKVLDWNTVVEYRLDAMRKGKGKKEEDGKAQPGASEGDQKNAGSETKLSGTIGSPDDESFPFLCQYGHASMQGTRESMEDEIILSHRLRLQEGDGFITGIGGPGTKMDAGIGRKWWESAFAIFDGHGGRETAVYSARNTLHVLRQQLMSGAEGQSAVVEALMQTERQVAHGKVPGGSCALVVHVGLGRIHLASIGDSLLVVSELGPDRRSRCVYQSVRRRPSDPVERQRIETHGGFVTGNGRLNGVLGVSRALGDTALKPLVSAQPDADTLMWYPDPSHEIHVIMACDGVWDVADPGRTADNVIKMGNARSAARKLRNYAKSKGSKDNITVIVLQFPRAKFFGSLKAQGQ